MPLYYSLGDKSETSCQKKIYIYIYRERKLVPGVGCSIKIPEHVEATLELGNRLKLKEFEGLRRMQNNEKTNDCDQNSDSNMDSEGQADKV